MKRHEPTVQSLSRKHKKKNKQLSNKRIRQEGKPGFNRASQPCQVGG